MDVPVLRRLSDYVAYHATHAPSREAAMTSSASWSYSRLRDAVDQCALALLQLGVRRGDRVATLAPPSIDFLVTFLGTVSIGAVWLGLHPKQTLREHLHVLTDSTPKLLISRCGHEGRTFDDLWQAAAQAVPAMGVVSLGLEDGGRLSGPGGATAATGDLELAKSEVGAEDPALLVYTSGTTGRPKGALLSHRGLIHCCRALGRYDRFAPGMRILNNLPINHIASVGDVTATALVNGGAVLFMESFAPSLIPAAIERHRLTHWGQIPAMFMMTIADPSFATADLTSLRRITWGGNPAPVSLIAALRAVCPDLGNVYGLTETTGNILCLFGREHDDQTFATTIGRPVPEYEISFRDRDGRDVNRGEVGEIWTRGPHTMLGYLGLPEATAEVLTSDGWLKTGDLARMRADGLVELVGREKEMYKSGGYNVYPAEVEQVLEADLAIALAVVVPVPDQLYAEVGHAFLLPEAGGNLDVQAVRSRAARQLAAYKLPKRFHLLREPPLLPNGKVDRNRLAALALAKLEEEAS